MHGYVHSVLKPHGLTFTRKLLPLLRTLTCSQPVAGPFDVPTWERVGPGPGFLWVVLEMTALMLSGRPE